MGHLSHDESVSRVTRIILILGAMTFSEVVFALLGKGYLIDGFTMPLSVVGGVMIAMSLIKAYLIVFEFMHMKYEVPGLARTVLVPTFLLVWAVIAFFAEGNYWKNNRAKSVKQAKVKMQMESSTEQGMIYKQLEPNQY